MAGESTAKGVRSLPLSCFVPSPSRFSSLSLLRLRSVTLRSSSSPLSHFKHRSPFTTYGRPCCSRTIFSSLFDIALALFKDKVRCLCRARALPLPLFAFAPFDHSLAFSLSLSLSRSRSRRVAPPVSFSRLITDVGASERARRRAAASTVLGKTGRGYQGGRGPRAGQGKKRRETMGDGRGRKGRRRRGIGRALTWT